jgi:hypothetical protein
LEYMEYYEETEDAFADLSCALQHN